mmetsp:Transcript_25918/g.61630  ORF Transcript_25918/g.61630 Transcript_25918/m.61630 type:complete len:347 (+) Transcript_25918:1004-2044(+)
MPAPRADGADQRGQHREEVHQGRGAPRVHRHGVLLLEHGEGGDDTDDQRGDGLLRPPLRRRQLSQGGRRAARRAPRRGHRGAGGPRQVQGRREGDPHGGDRGRRPPRCRGADGQRRGHPRKDRDQQRDALGHLPEAAPGVGDARVGAALPQAVPEEPLVLHHAPRGEGRCAPGRLPVPPHHPRGLEAARGRPRDAVCLHPHRPRPEPLAGRHAHHPRLHPRLHRELAVRVAAGVRGGQGARERRLHRAARGALAGPRGRRRPQGGRDAADAPPLPQPLGRHLRAHPPGRAPRHALHAAQLDRRGRPLLRRRLHLPGAGGQRRGVFGVRLRPPRAVRPRHGGDAPGP